MNARARRAVVVEWIGRGGIAHTSAAWAMVLRQLGVETHIVTRTGSEIDSDVSASADVPRIVAHHRVAQTAARHIAEFQPDLVVVQEYIIPPMETRVYRAARAVGATVVAVIHDDKPLTRFRATTVGLARNTRAADHVLAHSEFVARRVATRIGRMPEVVPHPLILPMIGDRTSLQPRDGQPVAMHFGHLWRKYKGTSIVQDIAARGAPPWRIAIVGEGAPPTPGATVDPRFLPGAELVAKLSEAHATILPYRWASQSGAVILSQALGAVPVVSSVGGIPEQVQDGVTGRLVPPGAGVDEWIEVLTELANPAVASRIREQAHRKVWDDHRTFVTRVAQLAGVTED